MSAASPRQDETPPTATTTATSAHPEPTAIHTTPSEAAADADLTSPLSSGSEDDGCRSRSNNHSPPLEHRPNLARNKSSGTIIVHRDSPNVEMQHEEYDAGDARAMSPRRSSEETEKMGEDARIALIQQAKALQASLLDIVDRVESVRSEHEKLEGGNRFLQSYIGELMQTSKITSTGPPKAKGKGRSAK